MFPRYVKQQVDQYLVTLQTAEAGTGGALTGGVAVDGVGASFRKGGAALKRGCCDGGVFGGVFGGVTGCRTGAGGGGGRRSLLGPRLVERDVCSPTFSVGITPHRRNTVLAFSAFSLSIITFFFKAFVESSTACTSRVLRFF